MAAGSVRLSRLKRVTIPESLVVGNKFVKWDEDSSAGVPVTLRVDPKGYILYWKEQNKDVGYLDLSLVRDTRTGRQARLPKDSRLRDLMNIGEDCPLEEKLVTVCWGSDFVNVTFVTFAAIGSDIAKEWTDVLFACATSLQASNSSPLSILEKCHSILTLVTETEGRTPVRSIVKMFTQNKEEKRRVELVLESLGYTTGKDEYISKFTFDDFFVFYNNLCGRQDVDKVFRLYGDGHHLTAEQFMRFLNKYQRDPRLNEVLYPLCSVAKAHGIIQQFEPAPELSNRGMLSREGFLKYLLSDDNSVMPREKLDLTQDMTQSLAHYFINSSHNTYLTGHQLTGRSSVEIYRQILLTGCRCIELDCWDGKGADEEPIITHGFTVCTEISCREVLEAIADTAFKVSDYPVILSFENHCCQKQQAKLARYCRSVFGEMLLTDPFDSHPLDVNIPLPSPELLKRRILVKNKKRPTQTSESDLERRAASSEPEPARRSSCPLIASGGTSLQLAVASDVEFQSGSTATAAVVRPSSGTDRTATAAPPPGNNVVAAAPTSSGPNGGPAVAAVSSIASSIGASGGSWGGLENVNVSWEMSDGYRSPATPLTGSSGMFDDFDWEPECGLEESLTNMSVEDLNKRRSVMQEKGTAAQEVEAGKDMSALVNYIEPVRFHSFEFSEKRNRSYECTSFVETQATVLLKTFPVDFVNFNKRQLSRIYPKGTRVDSSNYMPQIFWNAGCQFVALNFQTLDLPMQLNLGTFEYNGRCGYLLKPDFMRRKDRQFDPFAESPVDGIVAGCVEVRIISGQFISDRKCGTFVEVDMFGLPTDTVRRKWRTRVVPNNAINPSYESDPFVFPKIVLPNLASLRIAVYNDSGTTLLGHRVLPVDGLRPGYRHIGLRNECNQPQGVATLFVYIQVKDFIIDAFAAIAAALSNPIAYQSELEKREKQLSILEDEDVDCKSPVYEEPISPVVNKAISAVHLRSGSLTPAQQVRSLDPTSDSSLLMYVARSTSVPGSPYQSSPNLAVGVDTKLDVSRTTRLKDAGVVEQTSLSDIKETKTFHKLVAKQSKQLETLRRKHEKVQAAKMMSQQGEIDKLVGSGGRSRTVTGGSLGKGNARRFQFHADIEENDVVSKLRRCHVDELVSLSCEHYRVELDLQLCHQSSVSVLLERLATARRDEQTAKLEKIHAREVDELKRRQDARNWDEMKELAKKIKDKNELARIRREAMQKHIKRAVEERQKLQALLECRRSEVTAGHGRLLQQIVADRKREEECLQKLFETRCSAIASKHRSTLVSSASNGANPSSTSTFSGISNPSASLPSSIPPPSPPPVASLPPPFPGTFPRVRAAAARIDPASERPASLDFPTQPRPTLSERHTPVSPTRSCGPSSPLRSPERPSSYGGNDLFGGGGSGDGGNFRTQRGKIQLMCRSETSLVDVESTWL